MLVRVIESVDFLFENRGERQKPRRLDDGERVGSTVECGALASYRCNDIDVTFVIVVENCWFRHGLKEESTRIRGKKTARQRFDKAIVNGTVGARHVAKSTSIGRSWNVLAFKSRDRGSRAGKNCRSRVLALRLASREPAISTKSKTVRENETREAETTARP